VCLPPHVKFRHSLSSAKSGIPSKSLVATNRFPRILNVGIQCINLRCCDAAYVPDISREREPYREAHLKLAAERCIFAGPRGDPLGGGLLLFATDEKSGRCR
jgi:hypothetical protein